MKYLGIFGLALILASCGGEENTDENGTVNSDGISSVVDNAEPSDVVTGDDKFQDAANGEDDLGTTSIEYYEEKHSFGNVFYPSENLYTFKFKNTGSNPLVIESATASCGCTIPNKPEEPIMPGEEGELDVIFRPKEGQVGSPVTKRITVTANTVPAETYLEISAQVMEGM